MLFVKMAGLQSCLRKVLVSNNLRVVHMKSTFHQTVRKKHLVAGVAAGALKNPYSLQKFRVTVKLGSKNIYRFGSTNATGNEAFSDLSNKGDNVVETFESQRPASVSEAPLDGKSNMIEVIAQSPKNDIIIDESLLPAPPPVPVEIDDTLVSAATEVVLSNLKEPSFESLGLNSYWPTGLIQRCLEYLHITWDLPWWAAIAVVTLCLKSITLPLTIQSRKNSINTSNHMPQIQLLQMKVTEARQTGNYYDTARSVQELQLFMKEKKIVSIGTFLPIFAQAPIFLSMFWGLRTMANLPVESMKTGGCLWFTDLTVVDPYYALPFIIAGTMHLIIETGAEGNSASSLTNVWIKYGLRAFPYLLIPVTINFPAAVQCYWVASNITSLAQVLILKIPPVRKFLNIPKLIVHDPNTFPKSSKKKGLGELKEAYTNMKIVNEIYDRERLNTLTFEKAGSGPIPRTFKRDPTKVRATVQK